jgi:starch-binding outer membrane protein, SusD/RagB family
MTSTLYFKKSLIAISLVILIQFIVQFLTGCKKLVEVNAPTTAISAKNVYTNDQTAAAVLTSVYAQISANNLIGRDLSSIGFMTALSADELTLYDGYASSDLRAYYQNRIPANVSAFWPVIYNEIYISNAAIEGLNSTNSLTPSVKKQLLGEAKFIRAFCYSYLVNLYGNVPLILGTDYIQNRVMSRTPKELVWQQIITDLTDAKSLLSNDYLDGTLLNKTPEHVRPTKWAATGLLARSYLYTGDWKNAEIQSSEVINVGIYSLDSLNNVFLRNSKESIWQLQPVNVGANTEDARIYVIPSTGLSGTTPVYLSPQLINSFEANDQRKNSWVDTVRSSGSLYYFVYKYKIATITIGQDPKEYNTVLRLGEQYLIRAEARAQLDNLLGARSDLNAIRERAGLKASMLNEKSALLQSIYHERQVELFTEWGHRWLDLKRTKTIDAVMGGATHQKGGTWNSNQQLYPIPPTDILYNGNLTQNPGY